MSSERAHRRRVARATGHNETKTAVDVIARHGWWLLPALLVLVTFIAFLPTLDNGFVHWDDDANFLGNENYRGLGPSQLRWMLTTFLPGGHYIPLTWLTFGIDYVLWGMNPTGYHLTNLLLHIASVVVFYAVAVRLVAAVAPATGTVPARLGGVLAALFFAVHPLRVESVAWVTERRDVLCGLFYLLAVLTYVRAGEAGSEDGLWRHRWYWTAVGCAKRRFCRVDGDQYPDGPGFWTSTRSPSDSSSLAKCGRGGNHSKNTFRLLSGARSCSFGDETVGDR